MQASDTTRRVFAVVRGRACSRSSTPGPAADLPAILITILLQQDNLTVTFTVVPIPLTYTFHTRCTLPLAVPCPGFTCFRGWPDAHIDYYHR
jgi:hypothetical protein